MILKNMKKLYELTIGEAEQLRDSGAVLEMTADGTILIYKESPERLLMKRQPKGGEDDERDTAYNR